MNFRNAVALGLAAVATCVSISAEAGTIRNLGGRYYVVCNDGYTSNQVGFSWGSYAEADSFGASFCGPGGYLVVGRPPVKDGGGATPLPAQRY